MRVRPWLFELRRKKVVEDEAERCQRKRRSHCEVAGVGSVALRR